MHFSQHFSLILVEYIYIIIIFLLNLLPFSPFSVFISSPQLSAVQFAVSQNGSVQAQQNLGLGTKDYHSERDFRF